jgi:hypothetical protein
MRCVGRKLAIYSNHNFRLKVGHAAEKAAFEFLSPPQGEALAALGVVIAFALSCWGLLVKADSARPFVPTFAAEQIAHNAPSGDAYPQLSRMSAERKS